MSPLNHPIPQRLPQAVRRGGDLWRPHDTHSNNPPQNNFTFRNDPSAPQYPQDRDRYGPSNSQMRRTQRPRPRGHLANQPGRGPRWATAARPLLSSKRGSSPAQMDADTTIQSQVQRFLPADDVSDSAEEDMDESDAENESTVDQAPPVTFTTATDARTSGSELKPLEQTLEPPTKRRATAAAQSKQDASVPKWSNPDPYTVLPPVDEAQRKRKDVVKIIRKARIAAERETTTENQVAANDDFISFSFRGDKSSHEKSRSSSPSDSDYERQLGVPGAPTEPRSFSHLNNLHGPSDNGAPGTTETWQSAHDLGPPPSLTNGSRAKPELIVKTLEAYPDQAEALGNRKRTYDDDIKGEVVRVSMKGRKQNVNGTILKDWKPLGNTNPTPWIIHDHRDTANPGFRLHKEICDFYEFVRPQRFEQVIREDLLQRLQNVVGNHLPGCSIHCFGSFAAAMYLPNADMDLVVISETFRTSGQRTVGQSHNQMYRLANYLQQIGLARSGSVEVIPKAKVPLIKFVDQMTGIRVDVSFENETGLIANDTFNAWKEQFPAMPILTTVIKQFLMMRGLNEVVNGGLGGFSVTCLVTSVLQNLPRIQSGEVIPEQHLGEMLLEFLDLYGTQFDLDRTGISMNPPGYYDKQAAMRDTLRDGTYNGYQRSHKLAILDPNNSANDISGGSNNVLRIFQLFSDASNEIVKAMKSQNRMSLLDWALGGNYRNFTVQRERLRGLYEARWGNPEPVASTEKATTSLPSTVSWTSINGGIHESNAMPSVLPANVFSNPLEANVTAEPRMKQKKIKRTKSNKKNKKQIKKAATACTSTPESNQQLTGTPLRNACCRAGLLKEKFPLMAQEIPHTISKQERQTLTRKFILAGMVPRAHNKVGDLSARQSMLTKVDKMLGGRPIAKKTRRSNAAASRGRGSNNPIILD